MAKIVGRILIEPFELPGRNVQFASPDESLATFYIYWSVSEGLKPGTGFTTVDVDVNQTHDEMVVALRTGLALVVTSLLSEGLPLQLNSVPFNEPNQFNVAFAPVDVVGCEF